MDLDASGGAQVLDFYKLSSGDTNTDKDVSTSGSDLIDIQPKRKTTLLDIPSLVRPLIWVYLDFESLKAVSETCTLLEEEILQFFAQCPSNDDIPVLCSFVGIMPTLWTMTPFRSYLDETTIGNLRLVCKNLATTLDYYFMTTGFDGSLCRGGSVVSSKSFASDVGGNSSTELRCSRRPTTIFDIYTQDLKRIFSYLSAADLTSLERACASFSRVVKELRAHPFQEYEKDSFSQITLMDLPSEIHEKILTCCRPSDRSTLRLVSKLMQFQVDTLVGVSVFLNDLKWNWRDGTLGKLPPASILIVSKIENLQSINYFVADYNCSLLTRLILDGPFIPEALIKIVKLCKNLQFLGFTYALQMASLEDELRKTHIRLGDLPIELCSLKSLNLKIREIDLPQNNMFRVHAWTWVNAFEMMKPNLIWMPQLSSFRISEESIFSHNLLFEVAEKILKFVVEHRHTLKYIEVILLGSCFRNCVCPTHRFEVLERALRDLKLKKYSHDCDWRISLPFTAILRAQTSLEQLSCFKLTDWEFYAGIISQNNVTLRSITIEKNLAPVIDLGALAICNNLEYLCISQGGSSNIKGPNHLRFNRFDPRLINLDKLPVGIRFLHILDQTTETAQIRSIPKRLKNLETLDLQFIGSWDGSSFGMTNEIVAELVQLRKLNCLFLEEIRTMEFHHTRAGPNILSDINLIPKRCSKIIINYGCVAVGTLIAKKLPSSDFMPEWRSRVDRYFEDGNNNFNWEGYYGQYDQNPEIIRLLELESEEEEEEDEGEDEDNSDQYANDNAIDSASSSDEDN